MGFIEETGAAQHLRDARIAPIYEGTNGIQANDLVFRKLGRDGGEAARIFLAGVAAEEAALAKETDANFAVIADQLGKGRAALAEATDFLVATLKSEPRRAAAAAVPYLKMFGNVAAGQLMARGARAAARALADGDGRFRFPRRQNRHRPVFRRSLCQPGAVASPSRRRGRRGRARHRRRSDLTGLL